MAPTSVVPLASHTAPGPDPSHTPPSSPPETARRRRRVWPAVLAVLLVLGLAGGGAAWWFTGGPGSMTRVPSLERLTQAAAQAELQRADLRSSVTEVFDESAPAGTVMTANPAAGAEVRKLSSVDLTVSKGQERYAAPGLVGTPAEAASATLTAQHLALGERKEEFNETVAAGTVIAQDPAAGTSLKPGAAVAVTVSKGRQPIPVTDFTGKSADQAKKALTEAGLTVKEGDPVNSDTVPSGAVVSQTPPNGNLFKGDTVTIVVSKGPVLVAVPATVGKQRDEATRLLKAAGFQVAYNNVLGGLFGIVRASDPAAGHDGPQGRHGHADHRLRWRLSASRARAVATGLLVLLTAVWGSTFFLIRDLVETVPPTDFLAVRFSIARRPHARDLLAARAPAAAPRVGRRARPRRGIRRGAAAPDDRPRAYGRLGVGVHHRDVRRAHTGVLGAAAARTDSAVDVGGGGAGDGGAGRPLAARRAVLRSRRDADAGLRGGLRAAHHRARPVVDALARDRAGGGPDDGDRGRQRRVGRAGRASCCRRGPASGRPCSTWRPPPGSSRCGSRRGRRPG